MKRVNKKLLILILLTVFSTPLYFYGLQNDTLEVTFTKDVISFSAVFYSIWTIAGVIFKELHLNRKEIALLAIVFVVNFVWYAVGDWSAILFLSLPAQFFGIVALKVFIRFIEAVNQSVTQTVDP